MSAIFFLVLVALAGAQNTDNPDPFVDEPPPSTIDVASELITVLFNSEFFQQKIHKLYQLIDLKVRFLKLVNTLLSRENLLVVRQLLDFVVRVSNFVISLLPEPVEEPRGSFLETLFPSISLNNPENPINIQRVNREVNITSEDQELLTNHKDEVIQVAKLLYNTP